MTGTSPEVHIYDDRVEIINPGTPIVPVEYFIEGSQSRNEKLARLMRILGICEEKGSGLDNVVTAAEKFQLPAPEILVEYNKTVVIIYGHRPFNAMSGSDRVRACYGKPPL